jgi:hypothetical protein
VFRLWQSGEWTVAEFSAFFHVAKIGWVTTAELKLASVGAPLNQLPEPWRFLFGAFPKDSRGFSLLGLCNGRI